MPFRFHLPQRFIMPPYAAMNRHELTGLRDPVHRAVVAAQGNAGARGAEFRAWFGGYAAHHGTVCRNMNRMRAAVDSVATFTFTSAAAPPGWQAYAWPQHGRHRNVGQYLVYLADSFGVLQDCAAALLGAHYNNKLEAFRTVVHEMCHLVFHANIGPECPAGYEREHYCQDARDLADNDPAWAAWNADNYAYFISSLALPADFA
jgi:hypothetical protein